MLAYVIYSSRDHGGEVRLKITVDDIDKLCEKYP